MPTTKRGLAQVHDGRSLGGLSFRVSTQICAVFPGAIRNRMLLETSLPMPIPHSAQYSTPMLKLVLKAQDQDQAAVVRVLMSANAGASRHLQCGGTPIGLARKRMRKRASLLIASSQKSAY